MKEKTANTASFRTDRISLEIDYQLSLSEILRLGKYDQVNESVNEVNFPLVSNELKSTELIAKLFKFGGLVGSEEATQLMKADGFDPSPIRELIFLGLRYPFLQQSFFIVGLGSTWKRYGDLFVPGLSKNSINQRIINLYSYKGIWPSSCRFLGIQKMSA